MSVSGIEPDIYDLVVVGAGFAGLCAGVRAAELGMKVVVLEKGDGIDYPCNSRQSGGILHIGFHDPYRAVEDLVSILKKITGGEARSDLIERPRPMADV